MASSTINLNFEDTAIAFAGKSNRQLKNQHLLFKMMSHQGLVNTASGLTKFGFQLGLPIKGIIKKTIFKQFCGGESLEETSALIDRLSEHGLQAILDYGIEGTEDEESFERTANEQIRAIKFANGNPNVPYVSSKISGLASSSILKKVNSKEGLSDGEKEEWERLKNRMDRMCQAALNSDVALYFDAEEYAVQDAMDLLVQDLMEQYNKDKAVVFNTVQLYRTDRLDFLKSTYEDAHSKGYILGMKLVRGAYMEKERNLAKIHGYSSPIQPDKSATDRDYNAAIDFCLDHVEEIASCTATHNEWSNQYQAEQMVKRGIDRNHMHTHFSQLLGMSDHVSFNLAQAGFSVSKYVPYGPVKAVIPYLIRRAEENTSVSGQMSRELSLIKKEVARRKS